MSVRTYNPSVRVGNWNEDIQLEEDSLKDFLERKAKGELLIQQSYNLAATLLNKKDLSISRDGCVHFGDTVMLFCKGAADRTKYFAGIDPRDDCALALNLSDPSKLSQKLEGSCSVSGTKCPDPVLRSVLVIQSVDGTPDGQPLRFGQAFHLAALPEAGSLLLHSDKTSFQKCAKKSRHQEVSLVSEPSFLTKWQVLYHEPQLRMEYEGDVVMANTPIIISHCKTNHNLSVEQTFLVRTPLGREYEISAHTYLNSHKAEEDVNKWMIVMGVPGDNICPVSQESSMASSLTSSDSSK